MRKDNIKKLGLQPKMIAETAWLLSGAFSWADTKEGHAYWRKVRNRLLELSKEAQA